MCKFKVTDSVRVTDPGEHHYDEVGIVMDRDPEFVVCYRVKFPSGLNGYFAAAQLVIAPHEGEYR